MPLSTVAFIFSFFGLLFTTLSAWFFSRPLILTNDEIEKISQTHGSPNPYAFHAINPHMKNALISDREMAQRGLLFPSLGFLLQAVSILLFLVSI